MNETAEVKKNPGDKPVVLIVDDEPALPGKEAGDRIGRTRATAPRKSKAE